MNKEDYKKYYIQNSEHYLIPKDVFNELFSEMVNWKDECICLRAVLKDIEKKCKTEKGRRDYNIWVKLNEDWKTLKHFNEDIRYNLHPIITDAYMYDIKNSINEILKVTQYDVIFKQDILDLIHKGVNK